MLASILRHISDPEPDGIGWGLDPCGSTADDDLAVVCGRQAKDRFRELGAA